MFSAMVSGLSFGYSRGIVAVEEKDGKVVDGKARKRQVVVIFQEEGELAEMSEPQMDGESEDRDSL